MIGKTVLIALTLAALTVAAAGDGAAGGATVLRVYLPRTVQTAAESLLLRDLAVVSCDDDSLAAKACGLPMGRAPFAKEELKLNRQTILSRLAGVGIDANQVRITGAEQVVITRNDKAIEAPLIVQAAQAMLTAQKPPRAGGAWQSSTTVQPIACPATATPRLTARLGAELPNGQIRVTVTADVDGTALASRELSFHQSVLVAQAVATADIPSGAVLTPQNIKIENKASDAPAAAEFVNPFGQVATQALAKGTTLRPGMFKETKSAVVIHRNEAVVMKYEAAGFSLTGVGQAMDEGRPGDLIRVRNVDTNRVLSARVGNDGVVAPVLSEAK